MNAAMRSRGMRQGLLITLALLTDCARAPAFDLLGSFFPAWLVCAAVAVLLTLLAREALRRYVEIPWPVLVYASLTALFTFALWLALFG
jgi:YtcA family